jgi:hypothetical protein
MIIHIIIPVGGSCLSRATCGIDLSIADVVESTKRPQGQSHVWCWLPIAASDELGQYADMALAGLTE